ncbi:MAG: asparagine synthase (glutamine-hydrolyzing) [Prosthecobacter sp.]|uniref:asparagine synthase (glutamine-hydrolyzing) n=1 Tax=Prosthecobacter sp. TaxID=1965333 RepID=UPI001A091959|nr:asparagine synthase (glutamine-hydrolyzing) [Prosthecobacter sp.]MBE2285058.1 asparagine synthase (glutamine-hydrolyzing) [Prosthecobacter sp.]
MCGILGGLSLQKLFDQDLCRRALDLMNHRGPDAWRLESLEGSRCVLGHKRLKILDLNDRANQPMASACGRYLIVFNGEVFNYRELRALLPGHEWRTDGDTEVLVELFAAMGDKMLDHLNGMFAFAIYDRAERAMFAARDRFGIKPFYHASRDGQWLFASEIPPLLAMLGRRSPDLNTIKTFLATGTYEIGTPTFFEGVIRLEAGCCMRVSLDDPAAVKIVRWYDVAAKAAGRTACKEEDILEELDHLLAAVVKRHLISDVPVGVNVSGGVDSSTLIHYVTRFHPEIHGFTQDYADPYSERDWVRRATQGTGVNCHYIMQDAEDCLARFESVLRHQAEPFGGVPVIGFAPLYECAGSLGVTVLLDGNGVDEIFLGYKKYHLADLAQKLGTPAYEAALSEYMAFWQEPRAGIEKHLAHARVGGGAAIDGTIPFHAEAMGSVLRNAEIRTPTLPPSTGHSARDLAMSDLLATKIPRALRFNDRISMMYSKELRVPFMDHELVEWGLALSPEILMNRRGTKAPVRELLRRQIDPAVAEAPKRTVQSPQREWLANEWRPFVEDILGSASFRQRGWICPDRAKERYDRYLAGDNQNSFFIWQWINLEIWARQFLD